MIHENPSNGNRALPCGQTDGQTDGRSVMTKLIIAFRNFENAPKNLPTFGCLRQAFTASLPGDIVSNLPTWSRTC